MDLTRINRGSMASCSSRIVPLQHCSAFGSKLVAHSLRSQSSFTAQRASAKNSRRTLRYLQATSTTEGDTTVRSSHRFCRHAFSGVVFKASLRKLAAPSHAVGQQYDGVFGKWTLDEADRNEVVAYRAGLSVAAAALAIDSALALLAGDAGLQDATRSAALLHCGQGKHCRDLQLLLYLSL